MLEGIEKRATDEARYLAAGGCTVRQTAQAFGVSKSTVYKDLTERLPHLDGRLYRRIAEAWDMRQEKRPFPENISPCATEKFVEFYCCPSGGLI